MVTSQLERGKSDTHGEKDADSRKDKICGAVPTVQDRVELSTYVGNRIIQQIRLTRPAPALTAALVEMACNPLQQV